MNNIHNENFKNPYEKIEMCKIISSNQVRELCRIVDNSNPKPQPYLSLYNPQISQVQLPFMDLSYYHQPHIKDILKPFEIRGFSVFYEGEEIFDFVPTIYRAFYNEVANRDRIICRIYYNNGSYRDDTLDIEQFNNTKWLFNGLFSIDECHSINERNNIAYQYLQKLKRCVSPNFMICEFYKPGWTQYNGKNIYLTPQGAIGDNANAISQKGQIFLPITPSVNGFKGIYNLISVTSNYVAPIIILYDVLGITHKLFEQANLPPKFLLFLTGKRGTFKTETVLNLTQIEFNKSAGYNFQSKPAAIESAYSDYTDSVLLVDDYFPTNNSFEKNKMKSVLSIIIRAFGDNSGIKRNTDFLDRNKTRFISQYIAQGSCILTGEFIDDTGSESSFSRCIFLKQDDKLVDTNKLGLLRDNPEILQGFIITVISCISDMLNNNQNFNLIDYITCQGKRYRNEYSARVSSNPRYAEYAAQLQVCVDLLIIIAREYCGFPQSEVFWLKNYFQNAIDNAIRENDENLVNVSPQKAFCDAIISIGLSLKFERIRINTETNQTDTFLVYDDEYIYMPPSTGLQLLNQYAAENSISIPNFTASHLADTLLSNKIILLFMEGNEPRKTGHIPKFPNSRFWKIDRKRVEEISGQTIHL